MLTKEYLNTILTYSNGKIYWKVQKGYKNKIGKEAGFSNKDGYWRVEIDGKSYKRSRVIFLMFHGYLPKMVDHIDTDRGNNCLDNLRATDALRNAWNSKTKRTSTLKVKGVSYHSRDKIYQARIRHEGKEQHLGTFKTLEEAEKCVREFREKHHKEFTNHGNLVGTPALADRMLAR